MFTAQEKIAIYRKAAENIESREGIGFCRGIVGAVFILFGYYVSFVSYNRLFPEIYQHESYYHGTYWWSVMGEGSLKRINILLDEADKLEESIKK